MKTAINLVMAAALAVNVACERAQAEKKVDQVPVGAEVQLTRADGALVEGTPLDRSSHAVKLAVGPTTTSVSREDIADLRVKTDAAAPAPKAAKFREITLPANTRLAVRLDTPVSSATSTVETPVSGKLAEAIVQDGVTVVPAGSRVSGVVTRAQPSARVKGRASLALSFTALTVDGTRYPIAARYTRVAPATKAKDAKTIGIPAAGGALIGAIAGGKKGAAVGAAAGGGAGTAVVLSTRGQEVTLGRGAVLSMRAGRALTVRVPIAS